MLLPHCHSSNKLNTQGSYLDGQDKKSEGAWALKGQTSIRQAENVTNRAIARKSMGIGNQGATGPGVPGMPCWREWAPSLKA